MDKSNGGTGSDKRGSFMTHAKQTKELMERHGISTVEELEQRLRGGGEQQDVATDGYDPSIDPLAWIRDEDEVYLVSVDMFLPGNIQRTPNKTQSGEVIEKLKAYSTETWDSCPFRFTGERELQNREHHHLRVDRFYADRVAESKYGKMPLRAPITPDDFRGRDHNGNPAGNKRPHSGDSLTELVRFYLQRCAGRIWLHWSKHRKNVVFDDPNPYGAKFTRFTPDPATVVRATAEGDLRRSWGEQ